MGACLSPVHTSQESKTPAKTPRFSIARAKKPPEKRPSVTRADSSSDEEEQIVSRAPPLPIGLGSARGSTLATWSVKLIPPASPNALLMSGRASGLLVPDSGSASVFPMSGLGSMRSLSNSLVMADGGLGSLRNTEQKREPVTTTKAEVTHEDGMKKINQYIMLRVLGKGSYGTVRMAQSTEDGQLYVRLSLPCFVSSFVAQLIAARAAGD